MIENNGVSPKFKPISPIGYIGYQLLFSIPVVGFICILVFSISDKNINRRNFARSYIFVYIITFILAIVAGSLGFSLRALLSRM